MAVVFIHKFFFLVYFNTSSDLKIFGSVDFISRFISTSAQRVLFSFLKAHNLIYDAPFYARILENYKEFVVCFSVSR